MLWWTRARSAVPRRTRPDDACSRTVCSSADGGPSSDAGVQPSRQVNPSASGGTCSAAALVYAVTTRDPGASEVLTFVAREGPSPRLLAKAAARSRGNEVFVQEVIAAMSTSPCGSAPSRELLVGFAAPGQRGPVVHISISLSTFVFHGFSARWLDPAPRRAARTASRTRPVRSGARVDSD